MPEKSLLRRYIHPILFIVTVFTTTMAGVEWITGKFFTWTDNEVGWDDVRRGFLYYALPFLLILTTHEFGHYFTARYYRIGTTLPYYIPLWLTWLGIPLLIGTMGAFIRLLETPRSRQQFFDVGIAGPLAGFVVAIGFIWYGYTHLPPPDYVFDIHPEYAQYGADYPNHVYQDQTGSFSIGTNLTFLFFEHFVVEDKSLIPPPQEIIHYPFLLAGYLALLFTAINLIPIGQLDGGHILYGLIGFRRHRVVSPILFVLFVTYAGLGAVSPISLSGGVEDSNLFGNLIYLAFLYILFSRTVAQPLNVLALALSVFTVQYVLLFAFPQMSRDLTWIVFAFLIGRVLGVYHPPAPIETPLSTGRKVLGWLALAIFVISFTPQPFVIS